MLLLSAQCRVDCLVHTILCLCATVQMTDTEKAPYVQLAMQDKARYEAELAEYRAYAAATAPPPPAPVVMRPAMTGGAVGGTGLGVGPSSGLPTHSGAYAGSRVYRPLMHGMTYTGAYGADDSDDDEDEDDEDDDEDDEGVDVVGGLHHGLTGHDDDDDTFHALMNV